jgi:glutamate synthase domain-containing protein 1
VAELLARHGRTVCESLRMLMPPVADRNESLFHRYHADVIEAWDGPAAVAFADGDFVGAALDRNGLRPCRLHDRRSPDCGRLRGRHRRSSTPSASCAADGSGPVK